MSPPRPTAAGLRPCMLLAAGANAPPPDVLVRLRRLGWDIYRAQSGAQARRLARMLEPDLVVLDADPGGESGWLTCAKLKQVCPSGEVVLTAGEAGPREHALAAFVGASVLVPRRHDLASLLHPLRPLAAPVAGAA